MINISTKTGDNGTTGLANGRRLSKADLRLEVIGGLDELNAWLGVTVNKLAGIETGSLAKERQFLTSIQQSLFEIGAVIAQAPQITVNKQLLEKIEQHSRNLQQEMSHNWHQKFLLPGGVELAAWLDVSRTVCRRVERDLVRLSDRDKEKVESVILKTINRLSDYLYVLRCFVNQELNYQEAQVKYE